jgi:hypothetical protein
LLTNLLLALTIATEPTQHVERHLDGALDLLRARRTDGLSVEQRANRHALVNALVAYRHAGRFPQNRTHATFTPVFVDPVTGVHCAMGALLALTGREDIVARVVATDNHVRVRELAGDAEFVAWLDEHGLTLDEAARVQPAYEPPIEPNVYGPEDHWENSLALAAGLIAANILVPASQFAAVPQPSARLARVGILVGLAGVGVGLASAGRDGDPTLVKTMVATGALGTLISVRRFAIPTTTATATRFGDRRGYAATIAPVVDPQRGALGLQLHLRF